ncbi:hypothetical protein [Streptomyces pseudogriseolus]|uniref:hypothetical protein n=1 Tax=Streptomyces pseudogriseolus TaxID=36817 RepID=UPI001CE32584|nr:hypothetical protein [Streptomyces pseudogriseolus]
MKKTTRDALLTGGVVCLLVLGAFSGYRYFTGGLERLPQSVCSGSVDREVVTAALPAVRKAEEGSRTRPPGGRWIFTCYVHTSGGSIISGEVEITDVTPEQWYSHYKDRGEGVPLKTKKGPLQILSVAENQATLYVPCKPTKSTSPKAQAFITDARTIGKTRATGKELRQAIADFAYGITRHAFDLNKCRGADSLPADLSGTY